MHAGWRLQGQRGEWDLRESNSACAAAVPRPIEFANSSPCGNQQCTTKLEMGQQPLSAPGLKRGRQTGVMASPECRNDGLDDSRLRSSSRSHCCSGAAPGAGQAAATAPPATTTPCTAPVACGRQQWAVARWITALSSFRGQVQCIPFPVCRPSRHVHTYMAGSAVPHTLTAAASEASSACRTPPSSGSEG